MVAGVEVIPQGLEARSLFVDGLMPGLKVRAYPRGNGVGEAVAGRGTARRKKRLRRKDWKARLGCWAFLFRGAPVQLSLAKFNQRCALSALILRGFRDLGDMRVAAQILP